MNTARPLTIHLEGIGLLGPGLNGWPASIPMLLQPESLHPAPLVAPPADCLPAAERRRVGTQIRLALAVGREAVAHARCDAATLPNVFSASAGDGDNCNAICETLASEDRLISPTRFHNSVHNAPAGYWSIAMRCMAASTSLCAYDGSFAAGLLETAVQVLAQDQPVLLVCADAPYPQPLHGARPLRHAFGVALVLSARPGPHTLATLGLTLTPAGEDRMTESLEDIRTGNPAARALPLLQALATSRPARVHLPYLHDACLGVEMVCS